MRRALLALAATLLLAATACSAAGGGAPKGAPANATPSPSFVPTPTGGEASDPYDYGY